MYKKSAFILLFCFILSFYKPSLGLATSFDNAYLRLNSQKANAALSGTICGKPSSSGAGTEAFVKITFPSDFTISSNASNWSTDVSNLPSGSSAWPSVSANATDVTSKTVTFSGSDLTSNTLYCFNFAGSSSTTGSSGDNLIGNIKTTNSLDNTIDSTNYATSILDNDEINVTASVAPSISDLPIAIESTTTGSPFPQDTTISYKITYGSNASVALPLTIQASWSQGTIDGSPTPSVDILDYVVGSASDAYNSTPPIVDTVNRTITWEISSFPAATTGQIITFSLKTNSSYTGPNLVHFTVSARAMSLTTVTPDQDVTQDYLYSSASITPTPSPTPTSAPSSGGSLATPTPTPAVTTPFVFTNIYMRSISATDATIYASTNKDALLTIYYGTSPYSLTKTLKTNSLQKENLITLKDLKPDTIYYFKIIAKDASGNSITSDIFTFKTALISVTPLINLNSLIVTSKNNILVSPTLSALSKNPNKKVIIVPVSTIFELQFALDKDISIKTIQATVRNKNVLGVNTEKADANSNFVNLIETAPGVYTGKLASQPKTGVFEIYVRISDYSGNITEQKLSDLTVTNKFSIFEKTSKKEVENARVLLYIYNPKSRLYEVISPQVLPIQNPIYSLPNGTLDLVLPLGRYKAEISGIGFNSTSLEFQIDSSSTTYPKIYLEKAPFSIINIIKYYSTTILDNLYEGQIYLREHAASNRLFALVTNATLVLFVVIGLLSFSAKTHIALPYLPYFFMHKMRLIFKKDKSSIIFGNVTQENNNPVSKANVTITSTDNKIIANLKTNRLGEFYFNNSKKEEYKISVSKLGFTSNSVFKYEKENFGKPIELILNKKDGEILGVLHLIFTPIEDILGILFESLLVFGLITEVYFIFTFGLVKIAPFLIVSIANLVLLFLFLYRPTSRAS